MRVDRSCNPISNSISIPFGVYGLICHSQAENNNVWGNNKESRCVSVCVCVCAGLISECLSEGAKWPTQQPPTHLQLEHRTWGCEHVASHCCRLKLQWEILSRFLTVKSAGCGRSVSASGRARVLRWIVNPLHFSSSSTPHTYAEVCACACLSGCVCEIMK